MVIYGTPSFKMRLLTFVLYALWEEACRIENGSSFHSFGPEYVKVFLKLTTQYITSHHNDLIPLKNWYKTLPVSFKDNIR